jgi:competence protein ComEC
MRSFVLGFLCGVAYLQQQAILPSSWGLGLCAIAALVMSLCAYRFLKPSLFILSLFVCGMAVGAAWTNGLAHVILEEKLPVEMTGKDMTLVGTIDNLPYRFEDGVRFNFKAESMINEQGEQALVRGFPSKIAVSWYFKERSGDSGLLLVEPGQRWQFTLRLKTPHGSVNQGSFDYELWLFEQGIRATASVRPDYALTVKNQMRSSFVWSMNHVVQKGRALLRDKIERVLAGYPYQGVIVALVIGDQRSIAQSDWTIFNRTGIGHLISISGLHITMVAGMFAGLALYLWRRSFFIGRNLPLYVPSQKVAALVGAFVALVYVLLAGFGVPAQRTLYMLMVVAFSVWTGRITNVSSVLSLALLVVMLFDPWSVLWPGFWLSFGAVAMILFASVGRTEQQNYQLRLKEKWYRIFKEGAHTQYVVTIGLVPLTMLLFGQVSLVSPLANAFAIPLVSLFVTPLALLGSVLPMTLSSWVLGLAHQCVVWMATVLTYLSQFSLSVWFAPIPSWWVFSLALLGVVWCLAPRGWPLRFMGILLWLPLLLMSPTTPALGTMWVTFFDVGQGMAILVETPKHRLLYDTGPYFSHESNGADRAILPYLRSRGIRSLDMMIVSHADNDHAGGALSILSEIKVGKVMSSLEENHPIIKKASQHQRCIADQKWEWDEVQMTMLYPLNYDDVGVKTNGRSCTLKIKLGQQSILLPGDIEAEQEADLLDRDIRSTVLLAPHHGSKTSSTQPFLDKVAPQIAVFQVGYKNRYRHPHPDVWARYEAMGIKRLRTDTAGEIRLEFAEGVAVSLYREKYARYWHGA